MTDTCCENKTEDLLALRSSQGRVLKVVLGINVSMFVIEAISGVLAKSTSLLADSLDMFGDASVYALTLYVLDRGTLWRSRAALVKGLVMAAFGVAVGIEAMVKLLRGGLPNAEAMGSIGALALAANVICLVLLLRHRSDDLNMRSTWLCSRNDIIANVGVLIAAGAVAIFDSSWPDLLVGGVVAILFLKSASSVLRDAATELNPSRREA